MIILWLIRHRNIGIIIFRHDNILKVRRIGLFRHRIRFVFPIKDNGPRAEIKVILPKIRPRNRGDMNRWVRLSMLPHDNYTVSIRCLMLDLGGLV